MKDCIDEEGSARVPRYLSENVEFFIRLLGKLPEEKLTQLKKLYLSNNKLTSVKGLEKLTKLTELRLQDNPDLTKAQIDQLQKALPKCEISSNPTK